MFEKIRNECAGESSVSECTETLEQDNLNAYHQEEDYNYFAASLDKQDDRSKSIPFELYKKRTTVVVRRKTFLDVVCDALAEYNYVGPNQRADLTIACR